MSKLSENQGDDGAPGLIHLFKTFAGYFISQVGIQFINMVTGLLIIQAMTKDDYARYTIINTLGPVMLMLSDNGIVTGISAIGRHIWQDNEKIGRLVTTAMLLRRRFAMLSFLVVGPLLAWMLLRNQAPVTVILLLMAVTMVGVSFQLSGAVMISVLQLRQKVKTLVRVGLASALTRLALVALIAWQFHIDAFLAVVAGMCALILETTLYIRAVKPQIAWNAPADPEYRGTIISLVKKTMPLTVYYCVQGQVSIWLISIFGSAHQVADIGATARLGVIFTTIASSYSAIAVPRFARNNGRRRLLLQAMQIIGSLAAMLLALATLTAVFPAPFLLILGSQYNNMAPLLWLVVLSSGINVMSGIVFGLNMSKGWVPPAIVTIPTEIVTQIVLLLTLNLGNTEDVLIFSGLAPIPPTLIGGYLLLKRIRQETE
jgi:O-antigen/teichoic acid export membrane protein